MTSIRRVVTALRRHLRPAILVVGILLPPPAGADPGALAAFEGLRTAILASDGRTAAGYLTADFITWMEERRLDAIGRGGDFDSLPLADALVALWLRQEAGGTLYQVQGASLVELGVRQGWAFGPGRFDRRRLTGARVAVTGSSPGVAILTVHDGQGRTLPARLRFVRLADGWKLDLMPVVALGRAGLSWQHVRSGMGRNQFLMDQLARARPAAGPANASVRGGER